MTEIKSSIAIAEKRIEEGENFLSIRKEKRDDLYCQNFHTQLLKLKKENNLLKKIFDKEICQDNLNKHIASWMLIVTNKDFILNAATIYPKRNRITPIGDPLIVILWCTEKLLREYIAQ